MYVCVCNTLYTKIFICSNTCFPLAEQVILPTYHLNGALPSDINSNN